jgi:hypothetical protein
LPTGVLQRSGNRRSAGTVSVITVKKFGRRDDPFSSSGEVQNFRVFQFLLRYVVIAAAIFAAYYADIASLPGMLLGMSSFVVALIFEAVREFYFVIIHREEIT